MGRRCRQMAQQEAAGGAGIGITRLGAQAVPYAFENLPAFLCQGG